MTVRVGVVGTGMIGQEHIRRITDVVAGAEVVAVCDTDIQRADAVAARIGARALPTGKDVILDDRVDAVVVTSWGPTHAEFVLGAIEVGKHVFCEKPLATTAQDARRIIDAEQRHGRRLVQVGFMRRYDPGYRAVKTILDRGDLGAPLLMHCAHRNPTVPETYDTAMAVQDTAVHELDVIRWLLDEEIVSAQVISGRRTARRYEHLVDPQVMLFETESGVRIDLEVFVNCRYGYEIRHETVCETGTVALPDPAAPSVRHSGAAGTEVLQDWKLRFADAFDREFVDWISGIGSGRSTGPSAWDGYAVAVTSDATVTAQETGAVVPVQLTDKPDFYRS